ncbi:hypothetical protein H6783_03370 [Candidatus Nomurabacteria bacterium]|nr:hypothetical protein [Candidatus Nomurabacteria bacterium]
MARTNLYPAFTLKDALILAKTIAEKNAGKKTRRLTVFNQIDRSPTSGPSRQLVTASSSYGLTKGSYNAEHLELDEMGRKIAEEKSPSAKIDAVLRVPLFDDFFQHYNGAKLPHEDAAADFLKEKGVDEKSAKKCFEIIIANGEDVGLIQTISGDKRIVSVQHAKESCDTGAEAIDEQPEKEEKVTEALSKKIKNQISVPALNINIQIELPGNATPEQYESIFKNMRKYLLDENDTEN